MNLIYNFLITGSSGYIGKILLKKLLNKNYKIVGISKKKQKKKKNFTNIVNNLQKKLSIKKKRISTIIHMASKNIYTEKINNFNQFINSNIKTTITLAEYAKQNSIKKFIFFSSLGVHGKFNPKIINNQTPYYDLDIYGLTKLFSENILKQYSKFFSVYILRVPGVIDENQNVPWPWLNMVRKDIQNNKNIQLFNPKKKFNSLTNIDDLVKIIEAINKKKNSTCFKIYNFGSSKPLKLISCLNFLKNYYKSTSKFKVINNRRNCAIIDNKYIEKDLGIKLQSTKKIIQNFLKKN